MNNAVLEKLYQRYYQSTYLYALSLCNDHSLAEDLATDAFIKAWLSLSDAQPYFQYWLLRVCRNLWIDYLRHQKHQLKDGEELLRGLQDYKTPEIQLLQDERNTALYKAIRALPSTDRELLTLYYFSHLSLPRIAEMLGILQSTAKTRLFRARLKLKQRMEDDGYEL